MTERRKTVAYLRVRHEGYMIAEFSNLVHSGIVMSLLFLFGNAKVHMRVALAKQVTLIVLFCDKKGQIVTKNRKNSDELKITINFVTPKTVTK